MPVQETSREAYRALRDIPAKSKAVVDTIRLLGAATNLDIAGLLGVPINTVTPRTNELVKLGIVEEAYRAPSRQTGRRSIYWQVVG